MMVHTSTARKSNIDKLRATLSSLSRKRIITRLPMRRTQISPRRLSTSTENSKELRHSSVKSYQVSLSSLLCPYRSIGAVRVII